MRSDTIQFRLGTNVGDGGGARGAGHGLGAACKHDVALAQEDVLGTVDDGLEAAATEAVDGESGHVYWNAAAQTHVAGADG